MIFKRLSNNGSCIDPRGCTAEALYSQHVLRSYVNDGRKPFQVQATFSTRGLE